MTKKGYPMDWYFQLYNLYRILISRNKDDLCDLIPEMMDAKLYLPENLYIIENEYKNYIW